MEAVKDIIFDDQFGLSIKDGDFKVAASDDCHKILIIRTAVGNWKEHPLLGVGIDLERASSGDGSLLKRRITVQLQSDNYRVNRITQEIQSNSEFTYSVDAERIQ